MKSKRRYNLRRLNELPYHMLRCRRTDQLLHDVSHHVVLSLVILCAVETMIVLFYDNCDKHIPNSFNYFTVVRQRTAVQLVRFLIPVIAELSVYCCM